MSTAVVERLKRSLPERLQKVRGDRSQRQFARDLGVFQQNVNRYESGTTPHTDFLITLAGGCEGCAVYEQPQGSATRPRVAFRFRAVARREMGATKLENTTDARCA